MYRLMSSKLALIAIAVVLSLTVLPDGLSAADLRSASVAYEKGDFATAFTIFKELAELGNPKAQANVAAMYARGEGTRMSNVHAYAWASLAAEGGEVRAASLADELRANLTPVSLRIADDIKAQFNRAALDERLMPKILESADYADREPCRSEKAHMPEYPQDLNRRGIQGQVYVEVTVAPDGRARNPRIILAVPPELFDREVRKSVLRSKFIPARMAGQPVPCVTAMFYTFRITDADMKDYYRLDEFVEKTRGEAEGGNVNSQMLYGMLLVGLPQLKKPRSDALPWFLKAAQAGAPAAQFTIGYSMLNGWGCQCEEDKSIIWLRKAAEADQADAQVTLASLALRGTPSDKDVKRAKIWLERAVTTGNDDARLYLAAVLAAAPSAEIRDPKRALALLGEIFRKFDDEPTVFEIRAAAAAAAGDFASALKDQRKAVAKAEKLGWDLATHNQRLARYSANEPWYGDLLAF